MPIKNGLFVTTPKKPDVAAIGTTPSSISTTEVNKLSYEDQVALDRAMYAKIATEVDVKCGYVDNNAAVEEAKTSVIRNNIDKLNVLSKIPTPSISCSTFAKFAKFRAKVEAFVSTVVDAAMELYEDSLLVLKAVQDQVDKLSSFCDSLDTNTSFTVVNADAGYLGIVDEAMKLANPELWAKLAECGARLANLPASILADATKMMAVASIESLVIIADTAPEKLSQLEDMAKESAKLVGDSIENLTSWESFLTASGLTKTQLVKMLPFGFNPGGDIIFAKDVYNVARNGGGTVVYEDIIIPSKQQMASAAVERRVSPKIAVLPTQGGGIDPAIKSVLSKASGVSHNTSGKQSIVDGTLVFGDTYTDQTGFIHILNDRMTTEQKIEIFRNNKQVRSRKLNPIPQPVPNYAP